MYHVLQFNTDAKLAQWVYNLTNNKIITIWYSKCKWDYKVNTYVQKVTTIHTNCVCVVVCVNAST